MKVGPDDGKRDQEPNRAAWPFTVALDDPDRDRKEQERENMGPGQKMNGRRADRKQRDDQGDEEMYAAPHHSPDECGGKQRNNGARSKNHAFQARQTMECSEDHVGSPLPGVPGGAGLGK